MLTCPHSLPSGMIQFSCCFGYLKGFTRGPKLRGWTHERRVGPWMFNKQQQRE